VLHTLSEAIAWTLGVAIVLAELALLVYVVRAILRRSVGRPRRRAALMTALVFGLFVLWSASRVVP
jgi:Na+-transporting methylmalonyl-CoA/oxaloacetate decarboxylase gamma subunit